MSVLPSLLFGISASLDALLVGCALGLQKVPLPVKHNLLISAVTLIGTVISISLGNLLLPLIPGEIATRTGSSILILFGLYYTGKWLVSRWRCSSSDGHAYAAAALGVAEYVEGAPSVAHKAWPGYGYHLGASSRERERRGAVPDLL